MARFGSIDGNEQLVAGERQVTAGETGGVGVGVWQMAICEDIVALILQVVVFGDVEVISDGLTCNDRGESFVAEIAIKIDAFVHAMECCVVRYKDA